jgi:hypothetical protein
VNPPSDVHPFERLTGGALDDPAAHERALEAHMEIDLDLALAVVVEDVRARLRRPVSEDETVASGPGRLERVLETIPVELAFDDAPPRFLPPE